MVQNSYKRDQVKILLLHRYKNVCIVEEQFKYILFVIRVLLYCGANETSYLFIVTGEIHQFLRPKMAPIL
jgi:hypothetical protein